MTRGRVLIDSYQNSESSVRQYLCGNRTRGSSIIPIGEHFAQQYVKPDSGVKWQTSVLGRHRETSVSEEARKMIRRTEGETFAEPISLRCPPFSNAPTQ